MPTISKKKLINEISLKTGIRPESVAIIVKEMIGEIRNNLSEGKRFEFRNFGVFDIVQRAQKVGRNPKDPKTEVIIPARNVIKFIPGRDLKPKKLGSPTD